MRFLFAKRILYWIYSIGSLRCNSIPCLGILTLDTPPSVLLSQKLFVLLYTFKAPSSRPNICSRKSFSCLVNTSTNTPERNLGTVTLNVDASAIPPYKRCLGLFIVPGWGKYWTVIVIGRKQLTNSFSSSFSLVFFFTSLLVGST